jgi:hypothetical protein
MAHFAKLDENNLVLAVHVVNNSDILDSNGQESEEVGIAFLTKVHGWPLWKQTSYNNSFRKNYAGPGSTYDPVRDVFIYKKPFNSWILNDSTCLWEAPITRPQTDTNGIPDAYHWNESTLSWDKEVLYRS